LVHSPSRRASNDPNGTTARNTGYIVSAKMDEGHVDENDS
jgi:hypothetical protein